MGVLILIVTSVLVVRSVVILVGAFKEFNFQLPYFLLFEASFYFLLELVPIVFMMWALASNLPVRTTTKTETPVYQSSTDYRSKPRYQTVDDTA